MKKTALLGALAVVLSITTAVGGVFTYKYFDLKGSNDNINGDALLNRVRSVSSSLSASSIKEYNIYSSNKQTGGDNAFAEINNKINLAQYYSDCQKTDIDYTMYNTVGSIIQAVPTFLGNFCKASDTYTESVFSTESEGGGYSFKTYYQTKAKSKNEFEINCYNEIKQVSDGSYFSNTSYYFNIKFDVDGYSYIIDEVLGIDNNSGSQIIAAQIAKGSNHDNDFRFIYTSLALEGNLQTNLNKATLTEQDIDTVWEGGDYSLLTMKAKKGSKQECLNACNGIKSLVKDNSYLKN